MLRNFIKKIMDSWIELECSFVKQEKHSKKRVLVLRKDTLGDYIIFIPTLKFYREFYKDCDISLVVSSISMDLSPTFSFIDKIIPFNQKKFRTNFFYRRSFMKHLAKEGFDIAIYPVWTRESIGDLMIKITKAKEKITFKTENNHADYIYTKLIDIPSNLNEFDRNMAFTSKIVGKTCRSFFPTIDISLLDSKNFEKIYFDNKLEKEKYIVLVPGSGATYKRWQLDKFVDIANYFIEKGLMIVISGTDDEISLGEYIVKKLDSNAKITNLIVKTNLHSLSHLLANAKLYFGNDTGTLHLAVAVGTPAIAIMGSGHFGRFFPYGDLNKNKIVFDPDAKCKMDNWKCSQNLLKCEVAPCIRNITVMAAKKEIDNVLQYLNENKKND